jgi:hypothetical protein
MTKNRRGGTNRIETQIVCFLSRLHRGALGVQWRNVHVERTSCSKSVDNTTLTVGSHADQEIQA